MFKRTLIAAGLAVATLALGACTQVPTAADIIDRGIIDRADLEAKTLDERSVRACYVALGYATVLNSEGRADPAADYGRLVALTGAARTLKARIDRFGQAEIDLPRFNRAFVGLFGRALQARVEGFELSLDPSAIAWKAVQLMGENAQARGGLELAKRMLDELRAGTVTVDGAWTRCLERMTFEAEEMKPGTAPAEEAV